MKKYLISGSNQNQVNVHIHFKWKAKGGFKNIYSSVFISELLWHIDTCQYVSVLINKPIYLWWRVI